VGLLALASHQLHRVPNDLDNHFVSGTQRVQERLPSFHGHPLSVEPFMSVFTGIHSTVCIPCVSVITNPLQNCHVGLPRFLTHGKRFSRAHLGTFILVCPPPTADQEYLYSMVNHTRKPMQLRTCNKTWRPLSTATAILISPLRQHFQRIWSSGALIPSMNSSSYCTKVLLRLEPKIFWRFMARC
jgi:hypothetical protein